MRGRTWWRVPLAFVLLAAALVTSGLADEPAEASESAPAFVCPPTTDPRVCVYLEVTESALKATGLSNTRAGEIALDILEASSDMPSPSLGEAADIAAVFCASNISASEVTVLGGTVGCAGYFTQVAYDLAVLLAYVEPGNNPTCILYGVNCEAGYLTPPQAAAICPIIPTWPGCSGYLPDPYADLSAEARAWYESDPFGWPAPFYTATNMDMLRVPSAYQTVATFVLDPYAIAASTSSPAIVLGAEGTDGTTFRELRAEVGWSGSQFCMRHVVRGSSGVTTGAWSCGTLDPGEITLYVGWTHSNSGQFFYGWQQHLSPGSSVSWSTTNTNTINFFDGLPMAMFHEVASAVRFVRLYESATGLAITGANSLRTYNEEFLPFWNLPGETGAEFVYPFVDPRLDVPSHTVPDVTDPDVPVVTDPDAPAPTPEMDPNPLGDPAITGTDTILGDRIGGFFDNLGSMIGSSFGWLGDLFWDAIRWLVDQLWAMFEWLYNALAALLRMIVDAIEAMAGALIWLLQIIYDALVVLTEGVMGLLSLILDAVSALLQAVVDLLGYVVSLLGSVIDAILSIPSLILDGLTALFVPTTSVVMPTCEATFPCNWVEEGVTSADQIADGIAGVGGCAAPTIGWSEFQASFPPPPGCSGATTDGASEAGDLFGYRTLIRNLLAFGLWLSLFRRVLQWAPWAREGDMPVGGEVSL